MNKIDLNIRIMLITKNDQDVENIKNYLDRHMRLTWDLTHCVSIREAALRAGKADLIILDLELSHLLTPSEIFDDVDHMAFEIPIIVMTGEGEDGHDLATLVMEKGAADSIVRGKFGRLVDAIEFSLIRQKISNDKRKTSDGVLETHQSEAADNQVRNNQILDMFAGGYSKYNC